DLVSEQVTGGRGALADQEAGGGEAVEELLVASRAGHRTPHGFPQFLAGGALAALALGLVALGAGRSLRCGPVPGAELLEPVLGFDQAGFGLGSLGVVVESGAPAVFADERGDDVDVVVGVARGCPAASRLVGGRSDAGRGDHASGDLPPLLVGENRVVGCGPDG